MQNHVYGAADQMFGSLTERHEAIHMPYVCPKRATIEHTMWPQDQMRGARCSVEIRELKFRSLICD